MPRHGPIPPKIGDELAEQLEAHPEGVFSVTVVLNRAMSPERLEPLGLELEDARNLLASGEFDADQVLRLAEDENVASVELAALIPPPDSVPPVPESEPSRPTAHIEPALAARLAEQPGEGQNVIVVFAPPVRPGLVEHFGLLLTGGDLATGYLEPRDIRELARTEGVRRISLFPEPTPTI